MPNDQNKASLLSSQLDFERVNIAPSKPNAPDFFDLEFDSDPDLLEAYLPSPALPENETINSDQAPLAPPAPGLSDQQPVVASSLSNNASAADPITTDKSAGSQKSTLSNKKKDSTKNDKFAFYAAVIALCGFLVVFAVIFYIRVIDDKGDTPSYLTLPEAVVNLDGQVMRIKVTVQVQRADREWLASHKADLIQLFPIVVTKINPDDLHTEQGFDQVRETLRSDLNHEMNTDKIQSILMDQLLTQTRE